MFFIIYFFHFFSFLLYIYYKMNWIFWGLAAAFATSIWGICLMGLPDAIKSDTNLKFLYMRMWFSF